MTDQLVETQEVTWEETSNTMSGMVSVEMQHVFVCKRCKKVMYKKEFWHPMGVDVQKKFFGSESEFWSWYERT